MHLTIGCPCDLCPVPRNKNLHKTRQEKAKPLLHGVWQCLVTMEKRSFSRATSKCIVRVLICHHFTRPLLSDIGHASNTSLQRQPRLARGLDKTHLHVGVFHAPSRVHVLPDLGMSTPYSDLGVWVFWNEVVARQQRGRIERATNTTKALREGVCGRLRPPLPFSIFLRLRPKDS